MIKIENLSYSVRQKDLYHKISFELEDGQHCAFIGSSGTGKSTLVQLIMNPEEYLFDGKIEVSSSARIGYVSQFSNFDASNDMTVFDYIGAPFLTLQAEIAAICSEMETATDLEPLLEKYQVVYDQFQSMDGDNFESNITKNLNLVNLNQYESCMLSTLSGGEYKLIQIIKEMMTMPTLLIMDEPDVYLDFNRLNGLRDLIQSYKGTLLVITHNRYLLNHCFNKIIHLENKELQEFDGRYIDYTLSLLQTKIEILEQSCADDEEIERNKKIVDKLRNEATIYTCASRGRALNARVSHLERLEARRIKPPFVEIKQPNIEFVADPVLEDLTALTVTDYQLAFDECLLTDVNFELKAGEKVALVGANGTGKTSMLRDIYENNKESITIHDDVTISFLSQLQGEMVNEENTIADEFFDAGFERRDDIIEYLSQYGFDEESMNTKIGALSGGEKNILQLAMIATQHANMLLLDEPTSHLDTYAQIALEQAINNYSGTVLMISHDFYTIANCMDYILFIENNTIRRMSIRKFRKMIYANHFNKDYLELEKKKKEIETKISHALKQKDFTIARTLCDELEIINKSL